MSQRWGNIEDFDLSVDSIRDWYHIPALVVLLGFMLWVRTRGWERFYRNGQVLFAANDPWYHFRQVSYTVNNWPQTMPYDAWTYFPFGTSNSQFGTLFDQIVATAALIIGLGDPSPQLVATMVLFAPAVFGVLVAVPVYFAGRRLGGKLGGITGVLVVSLASGSFLRRSFVGFSDHHIAEVLFQMIAVLGVMVAISVAEKEMPVWELVANREWEALRRPAGWSALAGVGIALYIWVWPPAILLFGILGLFFLFQLSADYVRGKSPEPIAFAGVVSLSVAGLLMFVPFTAFEISATTFGLAQPLMAFGVALGCLFMAWLAREFDARDIDPRAYPLVVFGIIGVGFLVLRFGTPDLYEFFANNTSRFIGLSRPEGAATVGEAQPLANPLGSLFQSYGLTFITAFFGVLLILFMQISRNDASAELLFIVIWAVILTLATLTQARFEYYLVLPIAVLNAFLIAVVSRFITAGESEGIETFQILTLATILLVIIAPLAVGGQQNPTVWQSAERNGPSGGIIGWDSSLGWMSNNTPVPGTLGGADNEMGFYGTTERQEDFDYPDGAYGVISWWDYGHWITQRGERIPNANPFQQGATEAANFLLAPNESRANQILDEEMGEDDAKTRYVMIDWKMVNLEGRAGGKFFAPVVFYDDANLSQEDLYKRVLVQRGNSFAVGYNVRTQRFYESMVNRLWYFHGSGQNPNPVVIDYNRQQLQGQTLLSVPANGSRYQLFRQQGGIEAARNYVEEDRASQIGGIGPNPPERVDALEHYRLVHTSETPATRGAGYVRSLRSSLQTLAGGANLNNSAVRERVNQEIQSILFPQQNTPPWVKTFERVPGATIEGTGPANETITASVRLAMPSQNGTFTYRQRAETGDNGEFSMTVPYSSTGYDNWGPENGYTNVSVRAETSYRLTAGGEINESGYLTGYTGNATVTEAQVIGEDNSPTTVDLERTARQIQQQDDSGQDGTDGSSDESSSSDETSSDDTTDDSGSETQTDSGGESGTDTQSRVAAPP